MNLQDFYCFWNTWTIGAYGSRAGVNQQPPMHQLRMSLFNPFCGWTSSLPVEIFFSTSSLPRNSLPPPSYLPPPTYHLPSSPPLLPPPSYLPPTNPTPPHSIARAPETSSGCGTGVGAAGAGVGPAGVGTGPTRPRKGKMFIYFLFFLFVLFEEGLRSLLFLPLSLLHCSLAAAQQRRRLSSSSSSFFAALQLSCNAAKKEAFFFFLLLCYTTAQLQRSKEEGLLLLSLSLLHCSSRRHGMSNIGI